VNQALLDLDFEVRNYACSKHGHLEGESFAVPAAKAKPKKAVTIQPALPKPAAAPPPKKASPPKPPVSTNDLTTLEGFSAELKANRDYVICTHCFIVQRFCDFTTRLDEHGFPGSALQALRKRLRKSHGQKLVTVIVFVPHFAGKTKGALTMLYHHDSRSYKTAVSEAATKMRAKLHDEIHGAKSAGQAAIERFSRRSRATGTAT
jgi:hypothetical protein